MRRFIIIFFFTFGHLVWAQENPTDTPTEKKETVSEHWRFGLGGSLSLSSKLKFDTVTTTGAVGNLVADLDYSNELSIEIEARKLNQMNWGFIGGLTYDAERKLTGGSVTGSGFSVAVNSGDPSKIQATIIYGNAVYRWNQFYLPFGLNVSSIKFTPSSSYRGSSSVDGGLGGQLGVGYYINNNFVTEAYSRVVAVKLRSTTSSSTTDYGTGFLSNFMLTGKYIF